MPSMLFLVFTPAARAVPAAAESVTGDDADHVVHMAFTGKRIISNSVSLPRVIRLYVSAAITCPGPMPSPMK